MAAGGRAAPADMRGVYAKEIAERRRLKDVLCEQLSRDMLRLLNEELHADIVLCVDKAKLKAHKAVLWARTPRFYRYITRYSSTEKSTLVNVEASEIQAFLKIVYSSHYDVKETEESILGSIDREWLISTQEHNDDFKSSICDQNLSATDNSADDKCCPVESVLPELNMTKKDTIEMQGRFELEAASELGNDLLSLFCHSWCPDITIQTEDKRFLAHRAVLCARSSYFAAMLSGCWAESSQDLIQIQGICSTDMTVMMHFIYGGILDLPKNVEPGHILSIADMYGLEGLKEVAIYVLKRDYCRFFHKPVVGMQQSVLECLSIAHSLGEEQLYNSCMRWVEKYFVKCWSEKSFASLAADLQKQCLTALIQSLSYRNAAFLLMESDRLGSSLPGVKWAQRAKDLASELQEECVHFMVTNFSQIIKSQSFSQLLQVQGMSSTPYLLEQVFNEIEKSISFQNSCSLFIALDELFHLASENKMGFTCKIQAVRDKLWTFLLQSFYAVRHTEGWKLMRPSDQQKIQAAAVDKGDDRRLTKKPVLTSSQQSRTLVIKEPSQTVESKRHSEGSFFYPRKMKSDSLGASGHTSNVNRNSSGKGKEEDVRGKDGKKPIAKGTKDPKPTEKIVAAKPKIVSKPKPESNGSAKPESCNARGDTTGVPKTISTGRLGARPKVLNGGINPQTKVKSVKKTNKELSSPIKSTNGKSVLSNGEHPMSNISPGEPNHDRTSDDHRQSANCSPQGGKTLKCVLDASKDLGMAARLKSPAKSTNGASVKRKVNNEAECRGDTNSPSAKKAPLNGDSEAVLQKKKAVKPSNCTVQQRAKSAPASLSKKQGVQGDGATLVKSVVSSKQPEVKSDTKLTSQSTSTDKNGLTNKKNTKPPLASESKISAQKGTPTKQGLSGNKCLITNNKRPKQKAVVGPQSSKGSNHQQEQKASPSEFENSNGQETLEQATDKTVSSGDVEKDYKQEVSGPSGHSEHHCSDYSGLNEHGFNQVNSIQKQSYNTHESDLDHCYSQINSLVVVAELNPKPSADEQFVMNMLDDHKPEGKICDSENSKCADSSSESELCSVKEVERNTRPNDNLSIGETFLELPQNISSVLRDSKRTANSFSDGIPTVHQSTLRGSEHFMTLASERQIMEYSRDVSITKVTERHENSEIQFMDHWNKHSSTLLERESPESESGSASTSSDDIKPRSEDYDAGGSQDDDGSNDRGISKCSTMRCHDFLGRSSSDTSTPEELKGYDGNLRIDVKVKKENSSELFRVNSTSDDEGPRKRPDMWLQRDGPKHSINPKALCSSTQFPQEIEHLSSSADETEDERSEAENSAEKAPSGVSSQPFQGIVNLAFDDVTEIDGDGQLVSGNTNFPRSVLLSVDECEELGSDEGEPHSSHMRKAESLTPADVFEKNANEHCDGDDDKQSLNKNTKSSDVEVHSERCVDGMALVAEGLPTKEQTDTDGHNVAQSDIYKGFFKHSESEFKSQTRPCRLDLYTADSPDTQRFCPIKTQNACKSDNLAYQGKESHESPTENSNTSLPEGHIDDFDSLAQTCIYEHRPSKSLSPIYEMDPGDGNEQRLKTETRSMDFDFQDQHFVEGDWTLLRQLLAEHGSDVDIINSVPEDLSLAQYLINQTLLLARENSKSQGKAQVDTSSKWGDLTSPFDDSTSATVTSFSPDDSSPHGEWTILELETHH